MNILLNPFFFYRFINCLDLNENVSAHDEIKADKEVKVLLISEHKSVQANLLTQSRSKATQTKLKMRENTTSPIKTARSVATAPHTKFTRRDKQSTLYIIRPTKRKLSLMLEETYE